MQKQKGLFITFEGADGSGKTTQSKMLFDYLRSSGYDVIATREPGGTLAGERIREILLDPVCKMGKRTETYLYLAVRAEHVDEVVQPALDAKKIVISDRFSDSTFVYQGMVRGLEEKTIYTLNDFAAAGIEPDITFLLDAEPEVLQKRMDKRNTADRIEQEGLIFQKKVREGFLQLAQKYPDRIVKLDALREADEIQEEIRNKVKEKFLQG